MKKKMGSTVKSIVLKTRKGLDDFCDNKSILKDMKEECIKDLKLLNEYLRNCKNITDQRELTTAISEVNSLRHKINGFLLSNTFDNIPSTSNINKGSQNTIVWKDTQSAFENRIQTGVIINKAHIDPKQFLEDCCKVFIGKINCIFKREFSLKINAVLCCEFKIIKDEEVLFELHYLDTNSEPLFKFDDTPNWYTAHIKEPLLAKLEELQERDSGWALSAVVDLMVNINKYTMLLGGSFVDLPNEIKVKKACVNVQNDDNACFAWAVVSAIYPVHSGSNRMNKYPYYKDVLNLKGITFPMTINQIPRFEIQNNMSINVFSLTLNSEERSSEKFTVLPTYVCRDVKEKHINLLLVQSTYSDASESNTEYDDDEDVKPIKYHYVWIRSLSRLLSSQLSGNKSQKHICNCCLHYFASSKILNEHTRDCFQKNISKIRFPSRDLGNIVFKNYSKKIKAPFVIYAGIEYLFSDMKRYKKRNPCNIAYYVKCSYDSTLSFYKSYRGEDCISWFTRELQQFAEDVSTVFICDYPRSEMTAQEKKILTDTDSLCLCYICKNPLTKTCRRLPNYCRFTGVYRGPAHEICNMNFRESHSIPVFFHNLSGFDSHLLMTNFEKDFEGRIEVNKIKNKESFITFIKRTDSAIKFRFSDSFEYMKGNLYTLSSYLTSFPVFRSEMAHLTDEQFILLTKKAAYPDKYFDDILKFLETTLPPISKFDDIAQLEYKNAKRIWNVFKLQNLGEYSDLCLKTNVLLLAEVFEEFRDKCLEKYELDPSHYHTFAAYTWDVMLKQTNISLDLLTNIDMMEFIERGTRGGLSQCSMRYSKANNIYLEGYNYTKPSKYLMNFDVNNQYNWAMSQCLPYGQFKWIEDLNNFNVENVADDALVGYILEVDLEYPSDIHDLHKDLPLCPEYQSAPDSKQQKKLIATLHSKVKYILHYRNLKLVLKHGLILKKIHRILQFEQSPWLKTYIDLNRYLNISARNDFERNLFELMNYSVFEKFQENFRKNSNMKLVTKWEGRYGAEAQVSKPEFKSSTIINHKLVVIELNSNEIYLNQPIYVGMCLLDLAKTRVYDFHYQYMQQKFGRFCTICYIDTDSILYEVTSIDIYNSMREDCEEQFDTSDYPHDNLWKIPRVNRKALGLIKDRNNGIVMSEFVGIRSKMYAVKLDDRDKPMRLKGINKDIDAIRISFEDYTSCLLNNNQTKVSLSLDDNKRQLLESGCDTLPWGHYSLDMS